MLWMSNPPVRSVVLVVGGVLLAVSSAFLSVKLLPDDNHVIPPQHVGQPLDASVTTQRFDPGEVERGRVYFAQLCLSCHGVRGDGLGEWAYRVTPYPADLRKARTQGRSDQMLFDIISNGLVGTPMIGWRRQLTEAQRWQLVTYVRTLVKREHAVEFEVDG
jgi:mono/diheme cytochrome c family protein